MVFGFVNQSGGMIDVHSTEGRGTTFEIRLPAHRRTPSGVREADGDGDGDTVVAGGAETIVLVEGDEDVAGFAERGLTGIGYRVVRGRDGPSALDAARAHGSDVDLLVTDVGAR